MLAKDEAAVVKDAIQPIGEPCGDVESGGRDVTRGRTRRRSIAVLGVRAANHREPDVVESRA